MSMMEITSPTRAEFVERVQAIETWQEQSVAVARLAIGKVLIHARATLPHGQFLWMLDKDLGYQPRYAQKLMEVARNPEFVNTPSTAHLPEAPTVLYELAKMPEAEMRRAIEAGDIHPQLTQREARELVTPRPAVHIEARKPDELGQPIMGPTDWAATLKGYRLSLGISQLECDERSGLQSGYSSKLEIDVRRDWNGTGISPDVISAGVKALKAVPIETSDAERVRAIFTAMRRAQLSADDADRRDWNESAWDRINGLGLRMYLLPESPSAK